MRESSVWISARSKGVMNCLCSRSKLFCASRSPRCSASFTAFTLASTSV